MRAIEFITEARRNPEQNPKVSPYERVVQRAQAAPNNTFVSMTEIDKLGVNPQSTYNTPIGIYSYPAEYVIKEAAHSMKHLPFAGSSPFVNIFNARGNIVDVSAMTEGEYQQWANKASDIFATLYKKRAGEPDPNTKWKIGADIANSIVGNAPMEAKFGTPGGKFWYVTMALANNIVHSKLLNTTATPVAWNSLFRLLGIDGCVDHGDGIIHTAERNQCVIFNPQVIANVERVHNKWDALSREEGAEDQVAGIAKATIVKWVRNNPEHAQRFLYEYLTRYQTADKPIHSMLATAIQKATQHIAFSYSPNYEEVILPEALREMDNKGVWKLISTVRGLPNKTKLDMIQMWDSYVQGSINVDLLSNEFGTPEFIQYIENKIRQAPTNQKTNVPLLRLLAKELRLTDKFFLEMLNAGVSELTMEGLAPYVSWTYETSEDRIVPDALEGKRYALAALRGGALLTTENIADLLATGNDKIVMAILRRPGAVINTTANIVFEFLKYKTDELTLRNKVAVAFNRLSLSNQAQGLQLLELIVQKNPAFEPLLTIAQELYTKNKESFLQ